LGTPSAGLYDELILGTINDWMDNFPFD